MLKTFFKIFKYILFIFLTLVLLLIITIIIARFIHARQININEDNGIEESLYLEIGGVKQYIQIRGENKNNPFILVLHGGPGSPISYYSYYCQTDLEDDFTIVQWDQRGCGRTYYANKEQSMKGVTTELLLSDLDEIVTYLTNRFDQSKINILGHSWGTVIGSRYTQMHPEKVNAYISVGQVVDSIKGEYISVQQAIKLAKSTNETAENDISVAYEDFINSNLDMKKFMNLRMLTSKYLPSGENMSGLEQLWMGATSPQMGIDDLKWYLYSIINFAEFCNVNQTLYKQLFEGDGFNIYDYPKEYEVPVYFISGESDWITPYSLVQDYYEVIEAPKKEMIYIKNAGHSPYLDKPTEFCEAVKSILQP